jgi:hypothetical protein
LLARALPHITGKEENKMLGLLIPFIIAAIIIVLTLGITFLSIEMVLRGIGKGLGVEPATIRRPINGPVAYRDASDNRTVKTRLQAA